MFFLELLCFFNDPTDVGNLISGSGLGMNFACSFLVSHMDFLCMSSPFVEAHNWVEICHKLLQIQVNKGCL